MSDTQTPQDELDADVAFLADILAQLEGEVTNVKQANPSIDLSPLESLVAQAKAAVPAPAAPASAPAATPPATDPATDPATPAAPANPPTADPAAASTSTPTTGTTSTPPSTGATS